MANIFSKVKGLFKSGKYGELKTKSFDYARYIALKIWYTYFLRFEKLLDNHFEGIIAHASYKISTGKLEEIKNKIKTLRRLGYGYPDGDYFFLKLFDASRKTYERNVISHRI